MSFECWVLGIENRKLGCCGGGGENEIINKRQGLRGDEKGYYVQDLGLL